MRFLGLPIPFTGEHLKALSSVPYNSSRDWYPIIHEPYAGAWQQNRSITTDTAASFHADFACKTLIARDIAKLRVKLAEKDTNDIWSETTNPAYSPVLRRPNDYQTRNQFWECWVLSKLSRGNTYALKVRDQRNVVIALHILDPTRVQPLVSDDGAVFYRVSSDNLAGIPEMTVPAREIIHDRMNCLFHPLVGTPPVFASGLASMLGLNAQRASALLFENQSTPGGIITAPGNITPDQQALFKTQWEQRFGGGNYGRLAVLSGGVKYEKVSLTHVEGQLIENLKWSAEVVCSVYHVPPYKVGVGAAPSYNNIQALSIEYFQCALQSLIEEIEELLDHALGIGWADGIGTEFDTDNLLRMDTTALVTTIRDAVGAGVMSPNEGRSKLDLKPVAGGASPYLQQQNYSLAALAKRDASADPFGTAAPQPALPEPDEEEPEEEKSLSDIDIEHITKSHFESAGVIPFGLLAYNPNQPRDPGGEGGGQWVPAGGGDDDAAPDGVADPHKPVDPGKDSTLLTPEEQESITHYQGTEGFRKINNSLRAGNPPGEHAKRLSSAIAKHRLIEDTTVYRGIGNTLSKKLGELWRDQEGSADITFVDKGFVSTSMSKDIAQSFSKNIVKIKLSKGHNVLPIVDRKQSHEAEILLDKGTKFKVTNMRKTGGFRQFDIEIAA